MLVNAGHHPLGAGFVRFLRQEHRTRIIDCGFSGSDALFLEIPFCAITGVGSLCRQRPGSMKHSNFSTLLDGIRRLELLLCLADIGLPAP